MKNCFDGYLTDGCKNCEFWHDGGDNSIGCGCPFPISHCEHFAEMEQGCNQSEEIKEQFNHTEKA